MVFTNEGENTPAIPATPANGLDVVPCRAEIFSMVKEISVAGFGIAEIF
jgi:hypothetical protein